MLLAYETQIRNLIQAPSSPIPLINTPTIDAAINTARIQLAADAECIRVPASLALAAFSESYPFSTIHFSVGVTGVSSAIAVRLAQINGNPLEMRPWEWFANYYQGDGASGQPTLVAQQGQGTSGTLFFHPMPDAAYTALLDVAALPLPLDDDATPEAIPVPWQDAVSFYASWLVLMNLQRQADANAMLARYKEMTRRGRQETTPTVLPDNLPGGAAAQIAAGKTQLTMQIQQGR
jgi:hypothetical protein